MSVSDDVHTELRRRLIAGHFSPGEKLREEHIATELHVSRTPVRAALQRLITEGLLEAAPKRGAVVSQWTDNDIEEIFELRILAEGLAAAWATRNMSDADITKMEEMNRDIARAFEGKARNFRDIVQSVNHEFHMQIYQACGSARLRNFGTSLLEYPKLLGGFYIYSDNEIQESIQQHEDILHALRARNERWARSSVTSHLSAAFERLKRSRRKPQVTPTPKG
ncbi:GntR family transcriptional regulator [Martelella mediterranea]|uniref:GntR family transcriptional regulator n=1 Tax=Martelella mediterranea TaxID=293089 RepID=UPI001E2B25E0|nr:GntR family transcriptional regulator [Martelella mediterranea]MCD1635183.1 GntR family transcriptional regulator [Martelella mediterranea]